MSSTERPVSSSTSAIMWKSDQVFNFIFSFQPSSSWWSSYSCPPKALVNFGLVKPSSHLLGYGPDYVLSRKGQASLWCVFFFICKLFTRHCDTFLLFKRGVVRNIMCKGNSWNCFVFILPPLFLMSYLLAFSASCSLGDHWLIVCDHCVLGFPKPNASL